MKDIELLSLDLESLALIEANLDAYCSKHNVSAGNGSKLTRAHLKNRFLAELGYKPTERSQDSWPDGIRNE